MMNSYMHDLDDLDDSNYPDDLDDDDYLDDDYDSGLIFNPSMPCLKIYTKSLTYFGLMFQLLSLLLLILTLLIALSIETTIELLSSQEFEYMHCYYKY